MSTAASQYLREVKKRIPCSGSQKTEFLYQLEAEVIYYCEDHDDVNLAVLTKHFGTPEDVANEFLAELGVTAVNKVNTAKQHILIIFAAISIAAILLITSVEAYTNYKQQRIMDIHFIEEITYEGELSPNATAPAYWTDNFDSE